MTFTPSGNLPTEPVSSATAATIEIVVPVHDEERALATSIHELREHLVGMGLRFRVTIADNASTDDTPAVARALAEEFDDVSVLRLEDKGRGRALRAAWSASDADILCYTDVDLSTDLAALGPLVAPLLAGDADVAIGTRLASGANVVRGPKREFISRSYNLLLKGTLATGFSDAQCGFKAIRRDVARELLPHVRDEEWFFDTELLVLAERAGLRIHEVPVDWIDDPDSRVDIIGTALADLRGVARLVGGVVRGRSPATQVRAALRLPADATFTGQVTTFAGIGVLSTAAYVGIFIALRSSWSAQGANLAALAATAVANLAANRRFTFGVRGPASALRQGFQAIALLAVAASVTAPALAVLHAAGHVDDRTAEVGVLVAANLAAAVIRFLALRVWVFADHRSAPGRPA